MANKNLTNTKKTKNDEFYTQYGDIQKEIEAYFVKESKNEDKQCHLCSSCSEKEDDFYCEELERYVPAVAYCDFFKSRD